MMSIIESDNFLVGTQNGSKCVEISVSIMGRLFPDILKEIWHNGSVEEWRYFINKHNGKLKIKKKRRK